LRAQLQLDGYIAEELSYRFNRQLKQKPNTAFVSRVGVDFDVKENKEDKDQFLIVQMIQVNRREEDFKKSRYQINMRLLGRFRFESGIKEDVKNRMIFNNGPSILYGIARGIVAQLTGALGTEKFILPAVNFLAIAEKKAIAETKAIAAKKVKDRLKHK